MFIGISPGQKKEGSAGANRGTVRLAIDADATVVTIGDARVRLKKDVLVLWHEDAAGTFHGVRDPIELRTKKVSETRMLVPGQDFRGILQWSSSGMGDIVALVMVIDRPLAIATSGYKGRRGWRLLLLEPGPDGGITYERIAPQEYRARFATIQDI